MFVISRNTAFTYRNKPVDTKQIGRELGVRYVLEGSVQRLRSQMRITAQLIAAESDAHLWAERFDRDISDLFALQNEITSRIALVHMLQSRTDEAIPWLEKARLANPVSPGFHAWLASAYALKGDPERAASELAEARGLSADGRFASIARVKAAPGEIFKAAKIRDLLEATYFAGLRKAGMPEE